MIIALAGSYRAIVATGATGSYRYIRMELGRCPTGVALVAGGAVRRGTEVAGTLAAGRLAVVAIGAVGGAGEGIVISLGTTPSGGGLVAGLTSGGG